MRQIASRNTLISQEASLPEPTFTPFSHQPRIERRIETESWAPNE